MRFSALQFPTNCPYHCQDTGACCGPAAAMMILGHQSFDVSAVDQLTMLATFTVPPRTTVTDPSALARMIDSKLPSNRFFARQTADTDNLARAVVFSIVERRVPVAVATGTDCHWNVVTGVETDIDPGSGPYSIQGFLMSNPTPYNRGKAHSSGDDCFPHGDPDHPFTYNEWRRLVQAAATPSNFKFACILDMDPPAGFPHPAAPANLLDSQGLISSTTAMEVALAGRDMLWGSVEDHLIPDRPRLVHGLSDDAPSYYLVPLRGEKGIVALAQVDAARPMLRSIKPFREPVDTVFPGAGEALDALLSFPKLADVAPADPAALLQEARELLASSRLVWRPCIESFSPFSPFLEVADPTHGSPPVYIGRDSTKQKELTVFTRLTRSRPDEQR